MIDIAAALFVDVHEGLKNILAPHVGKLERRDGTVEPAVVAAGSSIRPRLSKGEDLFAYQLIGEPFLSENGIVNITFMGVLHSLDPEEDVIKRADTIFKQLPNLEGFLSNWSIEDIQINEKNPSPFREEMRCPVTIELCINDKDVLDMEGETFFDIAKRLM